MTVSASTSRADYTGNGVTTAFTVPFYFLDNTHLIVYRTQLSTGVVTTLALTTDYTVTGAGVSSGGTVTCLVAPTSDQRISILRNISLDQLTHYVDNDPFPASSHENALDKLTMIAQQLTEAINRAVTAAPNATGSMALPSATASQLIGWNASATGLTNVDPNSLLTVAGSSGFSKQLFSGDGVTVNFTLSANPGSTANMDVSVGGVQQRGDTDFTVSGTTLTFVSAPPSGSNNIYVRWGQTLGIGVPSDGSVTAAKLAISGGFSFRNKLINGGFDIWQRGTSFTPTAGTVTYTADRWAVYRATTAALTISRQTGARQRYALKVQRNAGDTTTNQIYWFQQIESQDCIRLAGKSVTVSVWAKAGANFSGVNLQAFMIQGTGIDEASSGNATAAWTGFSAQIVFSQAAPSTSLTKYTGTITIPAGVSELSLRFNWAPTGTAGADDSVTIEEVLLEEGTSATNFEARPIAIELALCQRYYYRFSPAATSTTLTAGGYATSATAFQGYTKFPVTMRTTPAALEQSGTAGDYTIGHGGGNTVCSSVPTHSASSSTEQAVVNYTVAAGLTAGGGGRAYTTNTSAYLGWSAEL